MLAVTVHEKELEESMTDLERRGDEVSEFLKKITEAREKWWEDLSRDPQPGRHPRQSRESPPERSQTQREEKGKRKQVDAEN